MNTIGKIAGKIAIRLSVSSAAGLFCAGAVLAEETPERRLVSLAPHITELLFAVGAGEDIVGVVSYSDYPPEARHIARIGSYNTINYEAILSLNPTLVLGWDSGNSEDSLNRLRSLGLDVFSHEPRTLEEVGESLAVIGHQVGRETEGLQASLAFSERLAELRSRYGGRHKIRLYYQLWNEPQMSVNDEHLISDVIRLCGGENILADAVPLIPKVSIEVVVRRDPEAIITTGMAAERPEWLEDWQRWPSITAVKLGQLYYIHPDLLHRHSPRILDGADQMCRYLDQTRSAVSSSPKS